MIALAIPVPRPSLPPSFTVVNSLSFASDLFRSSIGNRPSSESAGSRREMMEPATPVMGGLNACIQRAGGLQLGAEHGIDGPPRNGAELEPDRAIGAQLDEGLPFERQVRMRIDAAGDTGQLIRRNAHALHLKCHAP